MPLSRYEWKSAYSLADPELYRAVDRDDPQAVLEGVAMAGLVGVLRQLGDLAEFAAEVFHDLHEEVMVTAARGHGLKLRLQQLEAEFPSIEKAFLSQTDHSNFFHNTGVNWHPNMHIEKNIITRNGLPRFIMDYSEECRGPPQLMLLDKFDVTGSGACLKRYTDPSIFKTETATLDVSKSENLKVRRSGREKKKESHVKNGVTTDVSTTSRTKLHELFLEERAQNAQSGASRRVKLKKRQLDAHMLDLKARKSYMERFVEAYYHEYKAVRDISMLPSSKTESDKSDHSPFSLAPIEEDELPVHRFSLTHHDEIAEKELTVVGESERRVGNDGNHSDGVVSEIDDYMDALASEPEIENTTPAVKGTLVFFNSQKSDGGSSSYKKGSYSMSSSDTRSFLDDDIALDNASATETCANPVVCVDRLEDGVRLDTLPAETSGNMDATLSVVLYNESREHVVLGKPIVNLDHQTNNVDSQPESDIPHNESYMHVKLENPINLDKRSDDMDSQLGPDISECSIPYNTDRRNNVGGLSLAENLISELENMRIPNSSFESANQFSSAFRSVHINGERYSTTFELSGDYSEAMPPMPPLPPAEWRTGKLPSYFPMHATDKVVECRPLGKGNVDQNDGLAHQGPSSEVPGVPNTTFNNESSTAEKKMPPIESLAPLDKSDDSLTSKEDIPLPNQPEVGVLECDKHIEINIGEDVNNHDVKMEAPPTRSLTLLDECGDSLTSKRESLLPNQPEQGVVERDKCVELNTEDDVNIHNTRAKEPPIESFAPLDNIDDSVTHKEENRIPNLPEEGVPERGKHNQLNEVASTSGPPMPPIFGDMTSKLPKTRHPLMEAVATRDKSKLRKVIERVRPSLASKLDERDSFFEQIREGSFKLKPTPPTRPSIQGPKTNLTVVAIVEKASAMRQAIAGSDEDDDSDNWSDDS